MRFPQLHIAESVTNRILNALDERDQVALQSATLDAQLATPPDPNMAQPEGMDQALLARTLGV